MDIRTLTTSYARPDLGATGIRQVTPDALRPEATPTPHGDVATDAASATSQAAPAETPSGVDPALWTVLTPEERAFFAQSSAMGPLTYGRRTPESSHAGVRLGGRIDYKV